MTEALEQYSEAWFDARLGKVTASRVADVIAKTKSGWGASRKNYLAELVAERLTGATVDSYTSAAMQRGLDIEPGARAAYEFFRDMTITEVGFVPHPTIEMAGASPDGYVDDDGLVEIKCPNVATHIDTLISKAIPAKYITQMQFQMACTKRVWCDYVSFDPRMPEHLRLFTRRVFRDKERITELEQMVDAFLTEVDETLDALDKLATPPQTALEAG